MRLFVRWNQNGDDLHTVELVEPRGGAVVQRSLPTNGERVYGYCCGVVDTLKRLGGEIEMPKCLSGRHLCPDMSRED
jgi:hypothetical protein